MPFPTRLTGLAAAAVLASVLVGCSGSDEPQPAGNASPTAEESSATEKPSKSPSPSTSPSETATEMPTQEPEASGSTVPAYFVGDTPQGPRLFREFQRVGGDPLLSAARLVAGGTPLDPDYRTLWPGVEIESVQPTDGLLLVTLADDGFTSRPDGMSELDARTALQQMVYTLQGVQQERVPVQFHRPAGPARLFGVDIKQPTGQANPMDVLSMVQLTTPEQGATVTGDILEVSGVASSFEANVPWEVRRGNEVVLDGFTTAKGWMNKLYPFSASVDVSSLEPGDYTFVAMTDDPSGGAEGGGPTEDTRDFTLR
ncbi:MAG TPA: Gmad2 immunoglobulin-like domain-containing protein [Nocardioides sp.]